MEIRNADGTEALAVNSGTINPKDLHEMAHAYQMNPSKGEATWWAHFPLDDILKWLIASGVDGSKKLTDLIDETELGIKMYMIQHNRQALCPGNDPIWLNRNSVALVMTRYEGEDANGNDCWTDDGVVKNTVEADPVNESRIKALIPAMNRGTTFLPLDKTEIYPPGGAGIIHTNLVDPLETTYSGKPVTKPGTGT